MVTKNKCVVASVLTKMRKFEMYKPYFMNLPHLCILSPYPIFLSIPLKTTINQFQIQLSLYFCEFICVFHRCRNLLLQLQHDLIQFYLLCGKIAKNRNKIPIHIIGVIYRVIISSVNKFSSRYILVNRYQADRHDCLLNQETESLHCSFLCKIYGTTNL